MTLVEAARRPRWSLGTPGAPLCKNKHARGYRRTQTAAALAPHSQRGAWRLVMLGTPGLKAVWTGNCLKIQR